MDRQEIIEIILEHVEDPIGWGRLPEPDLASSGGNPGCGDVVYLTLKVDSEERIREVGWEGKGCNISMAGASIFADAIQGRTLAEVAALPPDFLLERIGRELAMTRPKCSTLALNVAKSAIRAFRKKARA